eukprot:2519060-Prymnesium_polylepis.1
MDLQIFSIFQELNPSDAARVTKILEQVGDSLHPFVCTSSDFQERDSGARVTVLHLPIAHSTVEPVRSMAASTGENTGTRVKPKLDTVHCLLLRMNQESKQPEVLVEISDGTLQLPSTLSASKDQPSASYRAAIERYLLDSVGEESFDAVRRTIKDAFKVRFREFIYFAGVFKEGPGWQLNQNSSLATRLTFVPLEPSTAYAFPSNRDFGMVDDAWRALSGRVGPDNPRAPDRLRRLVQALRDEDTLGATSLAAASSATPSPHARECLLAD